jgi:hypothetical protein
MIILEPQKGFQTKFLSSKADIVIGGSAAGVGKTFALLLETTRHITTVKGFGGIIFRRTTPQIRNEGGLWDTSMKMFPHLNATPRESVLEWVFQNGNKIKFSHLEHESNKLNYQGSQIPFIGFDELTHFSESMFFYLLTRNRSVCGVKPYIRATCNPDPDSWVAKFISWYIDQDSGFPIEERVGKLRYFIKNGADYIWGDNPNEVIEQASFLVGDENPLRFVKSLSFITGKLSDNKKLLDADPTYEANLLSQDEQTRNQLLYGNWKYIDNDMYLFQHRDFLDALESPINVKTGRKYITADIALEGSNMFVVTVWDGMEIIDIAVIPKSNGKDVIDTIKDFQTQYGVVNGSVVYDNDGVGGFIGGFIPNGIAFKNNGVPIGRENYDMLKTQCFYKMAGLLREGKIKISEHVQNKRYDNKETVRERLLRERRCIKKAPKDSFGKLKIITKEEMKSMLDGQSPDLMDCIGMRAYFLLGQSY